MTVFKTQSEVEARIKDGVLTIDGDVQFECSISINASIVINEGNIKAGDINAGNINARNINAWDINAGNINAGDINAGNINARNINARNINAWDINAGDINARDINAWDINAGNINARNINARNINYYAFLTVYGSIKCKSCTARRDKHHDPICLDGKIEIIKDVDDDVAKAIKLLEEKGKLKDGKILI